MVYLSAGDGNHKFMEIEQNGIPITTSPKVEWVERGFQGCDKQGRWTQRPKENQKTEMFTQEANHARGGSEANWCGPCSLEEGTQDCYEVLQKGEKYIPQRCGHHYQVLCKNLQGNVLFFLALLSKKPFQTPPERMARNNILSRSLR